MERGTGLPRPDDPRVEAIIDELQDWPGQALNSHKSSSQFFHKLAFLADIGATAATPGLAPVIARILAGLDADGIPTLTMNIGAAHGGTGADAAAWALCDAPVTLCALKRLGVGDPRLGHAAGVLAARVRENGWGCAVSPALGGWRGPGKAADPCPYATLVMTKLLLAWGDRYRPQILAGGEALLGLWRDSLTRHPYIFYMGNDFRKLKLPFVWYDILHVADVLSHIPELRGDPRLHEMFAVVKAKETPGGYIPESVYQPWKDWDFGQKKQPSAWMTERVRAIEARLAGT